MHWLLEAAAFDLNARLFANAVVGSCGAALGLPRHRQRHRTQCFGGLDRIALELQRSFDNFDRQFGFITLSRLMVSFVPPGCGLKEALKANLDLPVEDFVLDELLDLARVPAISGAPGQADRLLVLGAALRSTERAQGVAA